MLLKLYATGSLAIAMLLLALTQDAQAGGHGRRYSVQGDHFQNYYVPAYGQGVPAEMYPSPRPTPPLVGHTYYTYQPMYPQEMLYKHHRTYYHPHPMGTTVTKVKWRPSILGQINPHLLPAPPWPVGWKYPRAGR